MKVEIIDGDFDSKNSGIEPNTTQVPNIVIDWLMADLNGAEFKVLMFFVRQKYGFEDRRKSANVQFEFNISEIQNGIAFKLKVPNDGRNYKRVCAGTGLSRDAVASAIHSLSKMDFIDITRKGNRKIPHKIRVGKVADIVVSSEQMLLTDESFEKLYGRKNLPKGTSLEGKTCQTNEPIGRKNLPKGDVLAGKTCLLENTINKTQEDKKLMPTGASKEAGEVVFNFLYEYHKKNGLLPLESSVSEKVIYYKHGRSAANAIAKEDGTDLAIKIFTFATKDKYCQPVHMSKYKVYKAKYLASKKEKSLDGPAHLGASTVQNGYGF